MWCPPARKNRSRLLHEDERSSHWLFGGQQSGLHADEAESDLLNFTAAEPRVFVMWRLADQLARPVLLTVSYAEAVRMMDADERVDGVPIPADILGQVSAFAQRYCRPPVEIDRGRCTLCMSRVAACPASALPRHSGAFLIVRWRTDAMRP